MRHWPLVAVSRCSNYLSSAALVPTVYTPRGIVTKDAACSGQLFPQGASLHIQLLSWPTQSSSSLIVSLEW
ncbi:hypothetical protein E2C01_077905 [Portunus trituberculatus]|uniref:Uncharacterized protein n=1 Tax=Portunus trituberculatus TaxID=210409 RepID=A0A5B7ILB8_PORTR|nr:hypothetical protein [Portunus trituberculatus]